MANNVEKLNEPGELFQGDEASQIAGRLEEMIKADPSLKEKLNNPEELEEAKEQIRQELRKKAKSNNKE